MTAATKNGSPGPQDPLAKGLGAFSFALGIPQILAPGRVNRMIGVRDDMKSRMWMRAVGVREIAAGVGIFSERRPVEWVWARVAGDTMDLALLGSALRNKSEQPVRTVAATGAVIGAFAADLIDSLRLSRGDDTQHKQEGPMHATAAITIRRDRDELYAFWRDLESFPTFMAHVEEIRPDGDNRWIWKAHGPLGMDVEWAAEVTEDVPSERISWRSVEGSAISGRGTVRFVPAPGNRGTEVHIDISYEPPGGAVGDFVAKLFGEAPQMQLKDDLRRFKQIVETGEVMRSDGSPEGQLTRRQLKQRPAHPLADEELRDLVGARGGTS
jgi:uncharacterized membrane protein